MKNVQKYSSENIFIHFSAREKFKFFSHPTESYPADYTTTRRMRKVTKQMNLRLDDDLIKEFEELAAQENLDRSALMKKVLIEGLHQERLNFAVQKYLLKEISMERAAEISKMSIQEFIFKMSQLGIPSNLTLEDFEKIL